MDADSINPAPAGESSPSLVVFAQSEERIAAVKTRSHYSARDDLNSRGGGGGAYAAWFVSSVMLRAQPLRHARPRPLVHDVIRLVDVICLIQEQPANTGHSTG